MYIGYDVRLKKGQMKHLFTLLRIKIKKGVATIATPLKIAVAEYRINSALHFHSSGVLQDNGSIAYSSTTLSIILAR